MTKFKNLETGKILEVEDKYRIEKLKGYPDKFQVIEESKGTPNSENKKKINK